MKSIKGAVMLGIGLTIAGMLTMTYALKHPDLSSINSIQNSWLSPEEKESATNRIVRLGCDSAFRKVFKPGVSVTQTGIMDEVAEQTEAYMFLNDVAIIFGDKAFSGKYICTFYKDGREPMLNVSMDGGVRELLKKIRPRRAL